MLKINKIIGQNLLKLRKYYKLTQLELAEKFNYSDKSISKWETGDSLPNIEVLYDLANFYNVTLNDLANENFEINEKPTKVKDRLLPAKLIITLLAVSAVWMCATIIFVTLQLVGKISYPLVFLWAVPASCIVLIVFNSIWGKNFLLFPILTILLWSIIVGIHLQLIKYNIWMIYFLGIPLQIAIILWSALIKKSEMGKNTRQIKKEKRRKSKELKKEKELEKTDLVNKEENNTPVAESKEDLDTAKNYTESNKTINGKEESNSKGQKKHESIEDDDFGYDFFKEKNDIK